MELGKIILKHETKTFYKNDNKLIKVMNENYPQSDVLNEALNQTRAQELGLPVPKVIEVCKVDNKWAIISEYIEGDTLSHIMKENKENTLELMKKFVLLQLEVFSKTSSKYPGQPSKIHYAICNSNLSAIERFSLHNMTTNIQKYHNVCHGDFVPSNILISNDNKFYILDWSHTTQGNPLYDIVITYVQLKYNMKRDDLASIYLDYITSLTEYTKEQIEETVPLTLIILSTRNNQVRAVDDFVLETKSEGENK